MRYGTLNPSVQYTPECKADEIAYVERWNNTLRQRLGRFVRKTVSCSKSDVYHEMALKVFIHEYNENLPVLA